MRLRLAFFCAAAALASASAPAPQPTPFAMATPRPIAGHTAYMEHLERSGQIARAPLQRAAAAAAAADPVDPWRAAHLKGASYIPSTARNAVMHWKAGNYSAALTRAELAYGAAAGMNHVKLTLHYLNWLLEPSAFLANLEDTLAAAAALNLTASLALFEGPGQDVGADGAAFFASRAYLTSGWLANPGYSQLGNASLLPTLDAYARALTGRYGADARVVGWDVLYQPTLCRASDPGGCATKAFLQRYLDLVGAGVARANAWVTASVIPGGEACDGDVLPLAGRTLVAFENYNGNRGAVAGDSQGVLACAASLSPAAPLPVLLTGAVARQARPPSGVCETLFEAYGSAFLDIPAHARVGVILPGLMVGADQFTAGGANQGLVWPNGTWYSAAERACFAAGVPPLPPPPPGPPPPALNYTSPDGLRLGLRGSTRAVQVLGLSPDPRWFGNFSFVPPLWNFIPEKPHRDYSGCHHVGDATLRVQPASHANASEWAFYSTAQASDDSPAQVLPIAGDPTGLLLDLANLTQAMVAGGALDSRFPLGLQVLRSVERTPGGAPGFAIRWNFSVPAGASDGVRIGGLGFSLVSDTFFGGVNNTAIAAGGSFLDAHVGLGSGFVTFSRADGSETLLVTPCGSGDQSASPATLRSGMEAWRPLLEDPDPPNEGIYEWTVHSAAWAQEWARNAQAPVLDFPSDPDHARAWPHPQSPWPSWHLHETVHQPNPRPWNPPSALVMQPGQWADYALCFTRAGSAGSAGASAPASAPASAASAPPARGPRARDAALAALAHPLFTSVPGYVLGGDMRNATLYVTLPAGVSLASASCEDGDGVLALGAPRPAPPPRGAPPGATTTALPLLPAPAAHSRARLLLRLSSGLTASVHYYVLPALRVQSAAYGAFAAATSWLPRDFPDPFGRSASFMPWDREDGVHVLQDGRPFVVGLSDDAGGGAALGMGTQAAHAPVAAQVALLDAYVDSTLLGTKPDTATPPLFSLQDPVTWRIYMTLWYFDKAPLNATGYYQETDKCHIGPSWCAFNSPWCNPSWCAVAPGQSGWAPATYRQYNFPHQIGVYWGLYLTARNYPRVPTAHPAEFYLNASVNSILAANCYDAAAGREDCLVTVGLMDGTVFREVLRALRAEGAAWSASADLIEGIQRRRVLGDGAGWEGWNVMDNPAGSEFSWDTTGQEEVAVWGAYFNATDAGWMHGDLAGRTVDSILGYMTSVPTWAYHGAAYGMGDFSNNAKWMVTGGWEREGGHYRAGLNSIPVIERYRRHPDDFYLLQVGVAGISAPLPNIDASGAPSMAFHTHPFIMQHDPNSGDHGLGYFGSALNSAAYLHNHSSLGLLCFLCDFAPGAPALLLPRDAFHRQAYLEPLGLWLVAEAGTLLSVALDSAGGRVEVTLASSNEAGAAAGLGGGGGAPYAALRLRVEAAAPEDRPFAFTLTQPPGAALQRGAYEFPPNADPALPTLAVITFARL